MGKVYQLPRKTSVQEVPLKPVKGSPDSLLYTIIKNPSGCFNVVNRSSLDGSPCVVAYTAAKKDWAIDWIALNDDTVYRVNDEAA